MQNFQSEIFYNKIMMYAIEHVSSNCLRVVPDKYGVTIDIIYAPDDERFSSQEILSIRIQTDQSYLIIDKLIYKIDFSEESFTLIQHAIDDPEGFKDYFICDYLLYYNKKKED